MTFQILFQDHDSSPIRTGARFPPLSDYATAIFSSLMACESTACRRCVWWYKNRQTVYWCTGTQNAGADTVNDGVTPFEVTNAMAFASAAISGICSFSAIPNPPERTAAPVPAPDATDSYPGVFQQTDGKQAVVVHHELRAVRCAFRSV